MRREHFNPRERGFGGREQLRNAFGPWARGGFGEFPPGWDPSASLRAHGRAHGRGNGRRGGHRGRRGDVRAAILLLLAEQSRHGYEIIGEIGERSRGFWKPSPGSVYPTLQLLADEGLISSTEDGGKRRFELTDEGRAAAERLDSPPPWEQIANDVDPGEEDLRSAGMALLAAVGQIARAGNADQQSRAIRALNEARKAIYNILAEDLPASGSESAE